MNRLSESVTSISDTARQWGQQAFHDWTVRRPDLVELQGTVFNVLAGFIAEAVVREYLESELLLKAQHGPLFGNDIVVEDRIRAEVKTTTSIYKWKPHYQAWAPNYKPNRQDVLIYTYMEINNRDVASVLNANKLRLRGWIADTAAKNYPMLDNESAPPVKGVGNMTCRGMLQIPDADLSPMVDFVRFCFP